MAPQAPVFDSEIIASIPDVQSVTVAPDPAQELPNDLQAMKNAHETNAPVEFFHPEDNNDVEPWEPSGIVDPDTMSNAEIFANNPGIVIHSPPPGWVDPAPVAPAPDPAPVVEAPAPVAPVAPAPSAQPSRGNDAPRMAGRCSDLHANGIANVREDSPNYSKHRDTDGDGIACEN